MPLIRYLIFVWLFLATCQDLEAQDSVRVLTWNVQMLPRFVKANGKKKRARAIVEQLRRRNYDVIVFQEVFYAPSRKILISGLGEYYPYHTRVLNKKTLTLKSNGGVMLFSRHPIRDVSEIRFKDRMGVDRLSRKGALLADIDLSGKRIQVAGTHLQAFGDQAILISQYRELAEELLKPNAKPGTPQLVCGDFNTLKTIPSEVPPDTSKDLLGHLPRYQVMLYTLDAMDGDLFGQQQFTMDRPYNDLCVTRKDRRLLLDYILVRPNGIPGLQVRRTIQIMRQPWDKQHQDLSDHFGLEAVLSGY